MNYTYLILFAIVGVIFGILWKNGQLLRLSAYVQETREELRKCSWPTADELKGSTVVILISVALLGAFTTLADVVIVFLVKLING